jgi:hypothetical protein
MELLPNEVLDIIILNLNQRQMLNLKNVDNFYHSHINFKISCLNKSHNCSYLYCQCDKYLVDMNFNHIDNFIKFAEQDLINRVLHSLVYVNPKNDYDKERLQNILSKLLKVVTPNNYKINWNLVELWVKDDCVKKTMLTNFFINFVYNDTIFHDWSRY